MGKKSRKKRKVFRNSSQNRKAVKIERDSRSHPKFKIKSPPILIYIIKFCLFACLSTRSVSGTVVFFRGSPWKLPPRKLPSLPWKFIEASMEASINFHEKKQYSSGAYIRRPRAKTCWPPYLEWSPYTLIRPLPPYWGVEIPWIRRVLPYSGNTTF